MLLDHCKIRPDDGAAIEGADRKPERQRLDEHPHAHGWTAAIHGELNTAFLQQPHRTHGRIRQALIRSDQRAVNIRDDKRNPFHSNSPLREFAADFLIWPLPWSLSPPSKSRALRRWRPRFHAAVAQSIRRWDIRLRRAPAVSRTGCRVWTLA